jgi:hypothetical protein
MKEIKLMGTLLGSIVVAAMKVAAAGPLRRKGYHGVMRKQCQELLLASTSGNAANLATSLL